MSLFDNLKNKRDKEEPEKKGMSPIFQFLNGMTYEKKDIDFDNSPISDKYDQFMINRWISMVEAFIPIVNELNKHHGMSNQNHYNFLKSVLPKQKIKFQYIKKPKEIDYNKVRYIAHYFGVGLKEAELYLTMITKDDIKYILEQYKYGNNNLLVV